MVHSVLRKASLNVFEIYQLLFFSRLSQPYTDRRRQHDRQRNREKRIRYRQIHRIDTIKAEYDIRCLRHDHGNQYHYTAIGLAIHFGDQVARICGQLVLEQGSIFLKE